jgi:hypothetical protein
LDDPASFTGDVLAITQRFAPDTIAGEYDLIFKELVNP